jgi:hypothetical protein
MKMIRVVPISYEAENFSVEQKFFTPGGLETFPADLTIFEKSPEKK